MKRYRDQLPLIHFVVLFAISMLPLQGARCPAFPGAEGFGAYTPGGRGGKVIPVTNLNDSGPGSLRAACEATGPRIVVFRVSGIIELKSTLRIRKPYITIAGQTAPGGGICLKNYGTSISGHDVVVRHLRSRPGDSMKTELDALSVHDAQNIIIDHCSTSWSNDETLSVTGDCKDVTVQWCIISESLNRSHHHKGAHGYGSLIRGRDGGYTFHHNIYAHHNSRNPRPGGYPGEPGIIFDFRNNVIYNWGNTAGYNGDLRLKINYVGNYLKSGPSTKPQSRGIAFRVGGSLTQLFPTGNYMPGFLDKTQDNWRMITLPGDVSEKQVRVSKPFPAACVTTDPAHLAYERILRDGGAAFPVRDAVDTRIIEEIKTGKGRIIDSQADVGGWPQYEKAPPRLDTDLDGMPDDWERKFGLDPTNTSDNIKDNDGDEYTNIEEFLNFTNPVEKQYSK